jgi:hypothetical protein
MILGVQSDRDIPLVADGGTDMMFTRQLTVELYEKWYSLYVVTLTPATTVVLKLEFHAMNNFAHDYESAYVDHTPNPEVVARYAGRFGMHIPELAMELMVGRWMMAKFEYDPWWTE